MTWTIPNLITLSRLGFFAAFTGLLTAGALTAALACLFLAWALDAVDGWIARRLHQVTATGSTLDKATDRIVVTGGLLALVLTHTVPDITLLIAARDIGMLPALTVQGVRQPVAASGPIGKAVTVLQGGALMWSLLDWPFALAVIIATMGLGVIVATQYLYRVTYQ